MGLNPGKKIRLFQSPILEATSHVHPAIPAILYVPLILFLYTRASFKGVTFMEIAEISLLALLTWTFFEYLLHRFLFHFPPENAWQRRLHYMFHGIHHDDPNDATRLVMPPIFSIFLALLFFPLFSWLMGPLFGPVFFAGFTIGYLAYDYIHFFVHHSGSKNKALLYLKRQHLYHHVHDHENYGVSSPLWDFVFGTERGRRNLHA